MCIIVYKPAGVQLPGEKILKNCFVSNDDGAGFMIPFKSQILIKKGFETFENFYKNAKKFIKTEEPAVIHFRISTQGGVKPELTHPYPLCTYYEKMKQLKVLCDTGIAHNGVISLTSEGRTYDYKTKTYTDLPYNDTMKFIKEYASLIIQNTEFYKNKNNIELLKKLCNSKLAIMTKDKHVQLIGDFILDDDTKCYYSNSSYLPPYYTENISYSKALDYTADYNLGWKYYKNSSGKYDFYDTEFDCPCEYYGETLPGYCKYCTYYDHCKSPHKYASKKKQSKEQ